MHTNIYRLLLSLAGAAMLALPATALADTSTANGSAVITAGSLAITSSTDLGFASKQLNGTVQATTGSDTVSITDATGSGSGWNLTVSATQFALQSDATKKLATTALTVTAATPTTVTGSDPTNGVSLGSGATVPSASSVKIMNAAANTGMGESTAGVSYSLAIPAEAYVGTYASTLTYTLTASP